MRTTLKFAIVLFCALFVFGVANVWAQQPVKPADRVLKDTVIKSVSYKLYIGSRGGRYVLKTGKSGVVYKVYLK